MCDTCLGHAHGNVDDATYTTHTSKKERAITEKETDKKFAKEKRS